MSGDHIEDYSIWKERWHLPRRGHLGSLQSASLFVDTATRHNEVQLLAGVTAASMITLILPPSRACEWRVHKWFRQEWNMLIICAFIHNALLCQRFFLPTAYTQSSGLSTPGSCTFWASEPGWSAPTLWWSSFSPYQILARTTSGAGACLVDWTEA